MIALRLSCKNSLRALLKGSNRQFHCPFKKKPMELRFDRNTYSFSEPASPHTPITTECLSLLGEVMAVKPHVTSYLHSKDPSGEVLNMLRRVLHSPFNDLAFYMLLRAQDGCIMVELAYIDIYHSNEYCMGLQATYRSTFWNGSTSLSTGKSPVQP